MKYPDQADVPLDPVRAGSSRLLRLTEPRSGGGLGAALLAPARQAPKEKAKENETAEINPQGVAEFVGAACIVGGVDGYVIPDQQIGQGQGHQRSVDHAFAEACLMNVPVESGSGPIQTPAEAGSYSEDANEAKTDLRRAGHVRFAVYRCMVLQIENDF